MVVCIGSRVVLVDFCFYIASRLSRQHARLTVWSLLSGNHCLHTRLTVRVYMLLLSDTGHERDIRHSLLHGTLLPFKKSLFGIAHVSQVLLMIGS